MCSYAGQRSNYGFWRFTVVPRLDSDQRAVAQRSAYRIEKLLTKSWSDLDEELDRECRLSLSKVKLSGAHLGPRLGQVAPTWSMLGTSWAQVEPMLGLGRPMLGLCWPRLGLCSAYVGVCWPHVGLCWPYVEPSWGYVGHMLGICWLSWAYVGDMLGNLCAQHQRNVD